MKLSTRHHVASRLSLRPAQAELHDEIAESIAESQRLADFFRFEAR